MFRFRRQGIDRFERDSNHDANRIRDTIDTSPRAAWLFSRVSDLLAAGVVGGVRACRTGGRARLGPAGRRQCLHHEPNCGICCNNNMDRSNTRLRFKEKL